MDRPIALSAATMFVGALLLFWVQPLFGKMALPLLGGAPAVWNTAMVFFQFALLAGYAYADQLTRRLPVRVGLVVHAVLLLAAAATLPLTLKGGLPDPDAPIRGLLWVLAASVGLPFFVLSATAPLVQRWFSLSGHPHGEDPYFLYSASNLGSILGLLGYPIVLAPLFHLEGQSKLWAGGFGLLVVLLIATGIWTVRRAGPGLPDPIPAHESSTWRRRLWWVGLAFAPSSLLLGVTTHVTTDLVAVPLLWVLPLALYLLTWVITFARRPMPAHALVLKGQPWLVGLAVLGVAFGESLPTPARVVGHLLVFFWMALACHGELARLRPPAAELTTFFLLTSLGGILGGAFNALLAPLLFHRTYEYGLVFVAALALRPTNSEAGHAKRWRAAVLPALVALGLVLPPLVVGQRPGLTTRSWRSFFGVYTVVVKEGVYSRLSHGTTVHGGALLGGEDPCTPLTYYSRPGPLGQLMRARRKLGGPLRVGAVGLGTGSAVSYAKPGDTWTFYEIDPLITWIARDAGYFPFLTDCTDGAEVDIVHGDARLRLEDEGAGPFDVLILDAFSSDSIPAHLFTLEALELYRRRLTKDGLLFLHISNRSLALPELLGVMAKEAGLAVRVERHVPGEDDNPAYLPSTWAVVAEDEARLDALELGEGFGPCPAPDGLRPWTDDYSSLLSVLE